MITFKKSQDKRGRSFGEVFFTLTELLVLLNAIRQSLISFTEMPVLDMRSLTRLSNAVV